MRLLSSAALPVVGNGTAGAQGFPQQLALTPQCRDDDELTLAEDEGPFFKPNALLRHDLATDALASSVFRMLRPGQRVIFDLDDEGLATHLRLGSDRRADKPKRQDDPSYA